MLILTFEEFNNKFNIDNNAMSDIRKKRYRQRYKSNTN